MKLLIYSVVWMVSYMTVFIVTFNLMEYFFG